MPGYEASAWYGIGAPTTTPSAIVAKLNKEINAGLVGSNLKVQFADLDGEVFPVTPGEFGKFIAEETEKWEGRQSRRYQGRLVTLYQCLLLSALKRRNVSIFCNPAMR